MIARAVVLALLGAAGLCAQDLSASADALVDTAYPDVNFGSANYLQTGGTTTTYLRFDLSSLAASTLLTSPNSKVNLVLWVGRPWDCRESAGFASLRCLERVHANFQ